MTAPSALSLAPRTIIRFTGPDALRYLNGQVTQDLRPLANTSSSAAACVTDAKGRMSALVRIHCDGETWYVEAPHQPEISLYDRLTRYLIADDAEAADVSDTWHILHFAGDPPVDQPGSMVRASDRFGPGGFDLWLPANAETPPTEAPDPSGDSCRDVLETRRIESGIPEWGTDALPGMFPAELGLDRSAVSFTKGCYVGQEVISRMKYAGKLNRRLTRLSLDPAIPGNILSGAVLCAADATAENQAGRLTSIAPLLSGDGQRAALAMIERPWLETAVFDAITRDGIRHIAAARVPDPA